MSILGAWDVLGWVLVGAYIWVTFRHRKVFDKRRPTLKALDKQIDLEWSVAGATMVVLLYVALDSLVSDRFGAGHALVAMIFGIGCLIRLRFIAELKQSRWWVALAEEAKAPHARRGVDDEDE